MELFVSAVGLVLIFEGLPYFIAPLAAKNMAAFMAQTDPRVLRVGGFLLMLTGLGILYVFRGD
ncbi:MAG: DUF2065 domain-containing protein [Nitrospinae bacterium]|nr:DUF2065 domain-containing protein [Nitrospinota bacterium]